MKDEILLQTKLAHGGIQVVDEKSQADSNVSDDLNTFLKLDLLQVM